MTFALFRTFGECLEALPEMAGRGHHRLLPRSDGGLRVQDVSRCTPYPAEESHAVRAWHAMGGEAYPYTR